MGSSISNKSGKKIGIIGLGSIGLKHATKLKELGISEIYALRTGKGKKEIPNELKGLITNIADTQLFKEVDGIIISNPTALHEGALNDVIPFAKPLFIEKPLFGDLNVSAALLSKFGSYPSKIQIGFCLRFNDLVVYLKKLLNEGAIGQVYHARLEVGQYLPNWHPYTDYKNEYFSIKNLGGGVLRTLSHEIDLAQYFFGEPLQISAFMRQVSNLEINVEDYAGLFIKTKAQVIKVEIDFLQKRAKRRGVFIGEKGDIEYDIFENEIRIIGMYGDILKKITPPKNDMYLNQLNYFLSGEESGNYRPATYSESITQLKLINTAEKFNNEWKTIL